MSKKRKTRKQKEVAAKRLETKKVQTVKNIESPLYSIDIAAKPKSSKPDQKAPYEIEKTNSNYLKKDIKKIITAAGIIFAFNIILFALLMSGFLKLSILGY